jgi:hypothetical protein
VALIAGLVATLAAGLFAGAAFYLTFVEHPARVSCGSALAVTEFAPSYKRAAVMQVSLAVVSAAAGIVRWAQQGGPEGRMSWPIELRFGLPAWLKGR